VESIKFELDISAATQNQREGYLFICPSAGFRAGPAAFRWSECPTYWSLDPFGAERLSTEEATSLGFPTIRLSTEVHVDCWDASVYAGLRQFHAGKGFDPGSQELGRRLGHPLYQLSSELEVPFAHGK
jgi:hypothetical protein